MADFFKVSEKALQEWFEVFFVYEGAVRGLISGNALISTI